MEEEKQTVERHGASRGSNILFGSSSQLTASAEDTKLSEAFVC